MPPAPTKPTQKKLTPEQEAELEALGPPTDPLAAVGSDKPVDPPAPTARVVPVRFRVKKGGRCSLFGQMVTMVEGDVLEASSYGEAGLRRLRDGGIELEPAT